MTKMDLNNQIFWIRFYLAELNEFVKIMSIVICMAQGFFS